MSKKERCNIFWCWRKVAGYLEIGEGQFMERVGYCKKHGKIAREVISEMREANTGGKLDE